MQEMGNMARNGLTRGLLGLRRRVGLTGDIRIPNRKSGIRIPSNLSGINEVQISNRKFFAILDRAFDRSSRFLIYGSAIKSPRKALKT
jgi:hypothetical protein